MEEIKKLCSAFMNGEWDTIVKIYKDHPLPEVQGAKITRSGDTALHMAVYENREKIVEQLVNEMKPESMEGLRNERGNNPLHVAAKMGNERICGCIALRQPDLIGSRNEDDETPLLLAALHGKKHAFIRLHNICCSQEGGGDKIYGYGRKSDGSTVLHCAIDGEYFDLAYQIIRGFPRFVNSVDERGISPLHLLAGKHSAFKSSSRLTWLQNIIYHCIPAEKQRQDHVPPTYSGLLEDSPRVWRIKDLFFPKQIREMKKNHVCAYQIMKIFLQHDSNHDYRSNGKRPTRDADEEEEIEYCEVNAEITRAYKEETRKATSRKGKTKKTTKKKKDGENFLESNQKNQKRKSKEETAILIAAKNGISEMVRAILEYFPVAIHDMNSEGKNLMQLAAENRQHLVYQLLLQSQHIPINLLRNVDNKGNNILHLAAMLNPNRPSFAPNSVLQMQWETKSYEFFKDSTPKYLLAAQNNRGMTPDEVFMETHRRVLKNDTLWLMKISGSGAIIAALIAMVAFATLAILPGGVIGNKAEPVLKDQGVFKVFAGSSLVGLGFSLTAVVMFLATLTSRHQAMDFRNDLPRKLLMGLTALFISIASMLVSFCCGRFFIFRSLVAAEYAVAFLPVAVFAIAQCPLYYKLLLTTFNKVPERGFAVTT